MVKVFGVAFGFVGERVRFGADAEAIGLTGAGVELIDMGPSAWVVFVAGGSDAAGVVTGDA